MALAGGFALLLAVFGALALAGALGLEACEGFLYLFCYVFVADGLCGGVFLALLALSLGGVLVIAVLVVAILTRTCSGVAAGIVLFGFGAHVYAFVADACTLLGGGVALVVALFAKLFFALLLGARVGVDGIEVDFADHLRPGETRSTTDGGCFSVVLVVGGGSRIGSGLGSGRFGRCSCGFRNGSLCFSRGLCRRCGLFGGRLGGYAFDRGRRCRRFFDGGRGLGRFLRFGGGGRLARTAFFATGVVFEFDLADHFHLGLEVFGDFGLAVVVGGLLLGQSFGRRSGGFGRSSGSLVVCFGLFDLLVAFLLASAGEELFGLVLLGFVAGKLLFENLVLCVVDLRIGVGFDDVTVLFERVNGSLGCDVKFFGSFA